MELLYKPDFEEARAHWEAFWNHEIINRPCLAVTALKEGHKAPPGPPYMDALASIREPQELCMDLIDLPELIHRAMKDVRKPHPVRSPWYEASNMV